MSIFFMLVSIVAALFSCLLTYSTLKLKREIKASIVHKQEMIDNIKQDDYKDLSSGPRYREYGDLS